MQDLYWSGLDEHWGEINVWSAAAEGIKEWVLANARYQHVVVSEL